MWMSNRDKPALERNVPPLGWVDLHGPETCDEMNDWKPMQCRCKDVSSSRQDQWQACKWEYSCIATVLAWSWAGTYFSNCTNVAKQGPRKYETCLWVVVQSCFSWAADFGCCKSWSQTDNMIMIYNNDKRFYCCLFRFLSLAIQPCWHLWRLETLSQCQNSTSYHLHICLLCPCIAKTFIRYIAWLIIIRGLQFL